MAAFKNLRRLEELNIESAAADDSTLAQLAALPSLRHLNAARTAVSDRVAGIQWFTPAQADTPFSGRGDLYVRPVNRPACTQW